MVAAAQSPTVNVRPIEPNEELEEDPVFENVQRGTALFNEKKYDEVAEMALTLATEPDLRETIVEAQNRRVERFRPERVEAEFLGYVEEVCR